MLVGYNDDEEQLSEDIKRLKEFAKLFEGGQGTNANDNYVAVFTLLNRNYIWVDASGNALSGDTYKLPWKILKATVR